MNRKKTAALVLGALLGCQLGWGALPAGAAAPEDLSGKTALAAEVDPGSDDALALFLMKRSGQVPDLVLSTYGNAPEKQTSTNLGLTLQVLDLDLPVYHGADRPWKGKKWKAPRDGSNGKDGLLGLSGALKEKAEKAGRELQKPGSLEEARDRLKTFHQIAYITAGPLSTLAGLLQDPGIRSRVDRVYLVGGSLEGQMAEFNFAQDPKAVQAVLASGVDITLFPVELTATQYVEEEELRKLARYGTWPEFMELLQANQAAHARQGEEPAAVLPALFPVLYRMDPDQFAVEDRRVTVDKTGRLTEDPQGTLVHAVLGVNPRYQWRMLEKSFSQ
ncbi:MAG: nucleoside hydrolase [Acidaminococcus fermentans]|nr:nucleoside hydrolase [Acidaminococcus fermentans]MDY2853559.1 nucleoside hydrolase [Acidaminococcus fermentans]